MAVNRCRTLLLLSPGLCITIASQKISFGKGMWLTTGELALIQIKVKEFVKTVNRIKSYP